MSGTDLAYAGRQISDEGGRKGAKAVRYLPFSNTMRGTDLAYGMWRDGMCGTGRACSLWQHAKSSMAALT
eukprot:2635433-Rhodomonas_salina.2